MRLFLASLALAACPAAAQTAQPVRYSYGDYTFEISENAQTNCRHDIRTPASAYAGALFGEASARASFARPGAAASRPRPCPPPKTLAVSHRGEVVDWIGDWSVWLGSDVVAAREMDGTGRLADDAIVDLTNDGTPDLIIGMYSGGAHCCAHYAVVSLGAEPQLISFILTGNQSLELVRTDEGKAVFKTADDTFSYWKTSYGGSAHPLVVLGWTGKDFEALAERMRQPPLSASALTRLVRASRSTAVDRTDDAPEPPVYWATLLDLLYAGRTEQADAFARRAWRGPAGRRPAFLEEIRARLVRSPYAATIIEMNPGLDWLD